MKNVDDVSSKERRRIKLRQYQNKYRTINKDKVQKYNDANRLKLRLANKKYQRKVRMEALTEYGGRCTCCGETIPEFLNFDHIDGRKGDQKTGTNFVISLKKKGWPKDQYRLLCWNCNCGRQLNNGVCPHVGRG